MSVEELAPSFARLPNQAPQFDATAMIAYLNELGAKAGMHAPPADFIHWKRWVEATSEADGSGLRDVVAANAIGLNAVKADSDTHAAEIASLRQQVGALEARPPVPFPGSS